MSVHNRSTGRKPPPNLQPGARRPQPQSRNPPPPPPPQTPPPPLVNQPPLATPPAIIPPPALLNDPPWVLLAKAAGVYETQFAAAGVSDMAPAAFEKTPVYEQGYWAFCPIVGSYSMMTEGRTAFHKLGGAVLFALDMTMVTPVMRGIAIGTSAAASAGLKMVMNRGGTILQQQAMAQFIKGGGRLVAREAAEALIQAELRNGHVLIIGAETTGKVVNHVVAYAIEQGTGQIWRLHGGITKLAYMPTAPVSREALTKVVGKLNTMSVYHLAQTPAEVAAWWAKFAGTNPLKFLRNPPRGCAGSAVLMLEHLAQQGAVHGVPALTGAARWMPLYLDRALGGYVLNPVNVLKGTMWHGAAAAVLPTAFRLPMLPIAAGMLPQSGYNFEWSDLLPGAGSFGMVSDFYSGGGVSVGSVLGVPNAPFTSDIRQATASYPASGFTVNLPPPYVKNDAPPGPPPTVVSLNTLTGTWTTTEGGSLWRLVADNSNQPPGVWKVRIFSGNDANPFRTFQVKMRGADGKYIDYPFATKEVLVFHLINSGTLYQMEGPSGMEKVRRTWRR